MIATVVFSLILIVITSGIVHFTADYYKGIHSSATQTTARNVMNTLAQNFQYGSGNKADFVESDPTEADAYKCVGQIQINYKLGAQLGVDSDYGVFVTTKDPVDGCKPYDPSRIGKELLAPNMRLTDLNVQQFVGGVNNLYTISAGVAYGDIDLLCSSAVTDATAQGYCGGSAPNLDRTTFDWVNSGKSIVCKGVKGSQFCAFSHLNTQVSGRFEATNKPTLP
jgi:hypothetical protein